MVIPVILTGILLLVLLIALGRVNAFLAFLIVSATTGMLLGIPADKVMASMQKGIGDTLGSLVIVILCGAMLGKLVAESGAAQRIVGLLTRGFGERNVQWTLMVTGFIVGIPLFYNVGFVLLVPFVFSMAYQMKLPAVYLGIPLLAALSVTHGFLPPHPSPTALAAQLHADMGLTLLYGIVVSIPVIILAGPLFARNLKHIQSRPLSTFQAEVLPEERLPGAFAALTSALLPVVLLAVTTLLPMIVSIPENAAAVFRFFSDPSVVMILSLAFATFALGIGNGMGMRRVMGKYEDAVKDVSIILLVVAGAGALKQVFVDGGVGPQLATAMKGLSMPPLVLGWAVAAVIRVAMGSATVAGLTTAGLVAPVVTETQTDPNLMVLAVGAGSLMFSHVNDSGFWMYKEYFNLGMRDTFLSWSLMETIVSIAGLFFVMLLNAFL